jgi:antitoxin component YwqK of YwqJK toxin-antitoxin module
MEKRMENWNRIQFTWRYCSGKETYESEILNGEVFEKNKNGSWCQKTNYAKGIREGKKPLNL